MACQGRLRSFDSAKGFGFIDTGTGTDVVVHIEDCQDDNQPVVGDVLTFFMEPSKSKPGQLVAKNVKVSTGIKAVNAFTAPLRVQSRPVEVATDVPSPTSPAAGPLPQEVIRQPRSPVAPEMQMQPAQLPDQIVAAIRSMSKSGMLTDEIAKHLSLSPDDVVASLAKKRRTQPGTQDGSTGQLPAGETAAEDGEGFNSLAKRLQTDPAELTCPITHTLMEHPVVAEDGYIYEQEAIARWLRSRQQSPINKRPIGKKVFLAQEKKSAILSYKERTIQEIIIVVESGHLPHYLAARLLLRSDELLPPTPFPDAAAGRKMVKLLQLRAGLPAPWRGDSVQRLLELVGRGEAEAEHGEAVRLLLTNFEAWDVRLHMAQCGDAFVARLQATASGPPRAACAEVLDMELAKRLAARACDAEAAKRLWRFVLQLTSLEDPGLWLDGAALVLTAFHGKFRDTDTFHVDLAEVADKLLRKAVNYLKNPEDAASTARQLFGCDLGIGTGCDGGGGRCMAALLLELSRRCAGVSPAEGQELLTQAFAAAPSDAEDVREGLLKILLERFEKDGHIDHEHEHILLTLLFVQNQELPQEFLLNLSLDTSQIQKTAPEASLAIAKQLSAAGRTVEGARIAVLAAQAFEANAPAMSAEAFKEAYSMDRHNADAAEGVIVGQRATISSLQRRIRELEGARADLAEVSQPEGQLQRRRRSRGREPAPSSSDGFPLVWDFSALDFSGLTKGQFHDSPRTELGNHGVQVWIRYYPKGDSATGEGPPRIYLGRSVRCHIVSTFHLDREARQVKVSIQSLQMEGSNLKYVHSSNSTAVLDKTCYAPLAPI